MAKLEPEITELDRELEASAYALLVQRWNVAIAVVLFGTLAAVVQDWLWYPARIGPLLGVFVVQVALIGAYWRAVRAPAMRRYAFAFALAGVITHCVLTGISGYFRANVAETSAFLVVICMSAGTLLPLGVRRQVVAALVAASVNLAVLWAVSVPAAELALVVFAPDTFPVMLGFAVSVCVAYEIEQYRRSIEVNASALRWRSAALEASANALLMTDRDGRVTWANPAFTELTGYAAPEVTGQTPRFLKSGEHDAAFYRVLWDTIRSGHVWRGELVNRRKDGTLYTEEQIITPMRNSRGEISYFISVKHDISHRKQAEASLRAGKEAAEAANRAKSDFLANMSHEIRTPMNGIICATNLALDTALTPAQRELLDMVKSSADSLLQLIDDVLDFSKIEAGKVTMDHATFGLRQLLADTLKPLEVAARAKQLRLSCAVRDTVPDALVGDPLRLRQIIVNLVGNAIKFTPQGTVDVRVEDNAHTATDAELHFAVRDTGIGIPADKQARIFDAFEQADTSTTRTYGGTGLGLAISSNLVRLMGGRMWVDSANGRGSTFHFVVPFARGQDTAAVRPSPSDEPAGTAAAHTRAAVAGRPLRVLLAEDNQVNQTLIVRLLEKQGCQITVVTTGTDALSAWSQTPEPYDVVFMDVHMPGMDGFAATAAIRERERAAGRHTPIIAITASAMSGDREQCLAAGMDDYVSKPIHAARLADVLRRWGTTAAGAGPHALSTLER